MQKVNQDPMKTNLDSETNQHFFCGFHTNVNEIMGGEGGKGIEKSMSCTQVRNVQF